MKRIYGKDIALQVGVSRQAVTAVLNGTRPGCVSKEKREEILRLAKLHHYKVNSSARALVSGKTKTIGILMPWVETLVGSPATGRLFRFFASELEKLDYTLSIISIPNTDCETIYREIVDVMMSHRADGFLAMSCFFNNNDAEQIRKLKIPLVTFAMPSDAVTRGSGLCSVYFDCKDTIHALADSLRPYGKCATILSNMSTPTIYDQMLALPGFTPFHFPWTSFSPYSSVDAMRMILERWEELSQYKVILAQNDLTAYSVAETLRLKKLVPGRDVLVAGFDNIEEEYFEKPFLTTISPRYDIMAQKSIELLMKQIEFPDTEAEEIAVPVEIVYRSSAKPYKKVRKEKK